MTKVGIRFLLRIIIEENTDVNINVLVVTLRHDWANHQLSVRVEAAGVFGRVLCFPVVTFPRYLQGSQGSGLVLASRIFTM